MPRSSLVALSDGVRAYFVAHGIAANVPPCGWKERTKQINQGPGGASRVCFMPGEFDGTAGPMRVMKAGRLARNQRKTTLNPRELVSWERTSTVSVWGVDTSALGDEQAQIEAAESLLELTIQAMHNALDPVTGVPLGVGTIVWGDVSLVAPPVEQGFGREILFTFTHLAVFFDQPVSIAFPSGAVHRQPAA